MAQEQADLDTALAQAQEQEAAAEEALAEAKAARAEAQRKAEEEARRRAAAAAAQAAAEGAASGETAPNPDPGASENPADANIPAEPAGDGSDGGYEEPEPPAVDWMSDRDIFINDWGARIDAYLGGSPLGGYGRTFAAAAWDYGVDPRFSPAIAYAESWLGAYCFQAPQRPGAGATPSWGSWEEAIYAGVAGLARGYGHTLTYDGALKYCPPNADYWYNTVAGQMAMI